MGCIYDSYMSNYDLHMSTYFPKTVIVTHLEESNYDSFKRKWPWLFKREQIWYSKEGNYD